MSKKINREPSAIQLRFERGLRIGALIVGLYHLLMGIYRYYDEFSGTTLEYMDFVLFGALALATASYLVFTKMEYPDTMYRVKDFVRGLLRPEMLLLMALLGWYVISCLACGSYYQGPWLRGNAFPLLDTAINVFIFFPLAAYMPQERRRQAVHGVIHVFVGLLTVLMMIVLWNVYQLNILHVPGGEIGMSENVRLYINCNPNTTGAFAALLVMLCLYMVVSERPLIKALYGFALFVHMVILMLSNSRTCLIAVTAAFMLVAFVFVWHRLAKPGLVRRIVICALASVLTLLAMTSIRSAVFASFESITHFSELVALQKEAEKSEAAISSAADAVSEAAAESTADASAAIERSGANAAADITLKAESIGTRLVTWGHAMKAMVYNLHMAIFGVTPISVIGALDLGAGEAINTAYTHNQFLEIGVSLGFPGLFLFLAFLVLTARNCLVIVFSREQRPFPGFYVIPATIFMLVVSNLLEAILLFYHYPNGSFFYILCGWVALESHALPNPFRRKAPSARAKAGKKKSR